MRRNEYRASSPVFLCLGRCRRSGCHGDGTERRSAPVDQVQLAGGVDDAQLVHVLLVGDHPEHLTVADIRFEPAQAHDLWNPPGHSGPAGQPVADCAFVAAKRSGEVGERPAHGVVLKFGGIAIAEIRVSHRVHSVEKKGRPRLIDPKTFQKEKQNKSVPDESSELNVVSAVTIASS